MPESPKYRIIRKLESGGMAEVFHAELESMEGFKKQVAIKRVLPHLSQHREFIAMFLDEARLSLKFSHANIVQTFDIGVSHNTYFITMEYVDGVNLKKVFEYLQRHGIALEIGHAVFIANEMCKGLAYAHSMRDSDGRGLGVVHRDVSPPNVLLSRQGEVKLVDFGLAKAASQLEHTEPGIIKGKFSYLSPEAASGYEVDHRADIFNVGIMLWEMLAGGRKLFLGATDFETVVQVREAKVPPITSINRTVPRQIEAILRKALQPDPARRYQSGADMGRDLTQVMFSLRLAVSSYDVANLVDMVLREEPAGGAREADIVDILIEDELTRLSSIETTESIFDNGAKPISPAEISGMLVEQQRMEDPRKWVFEMQSANKDASPVRPIELQGRRSGWVETSSRPAPAHAAQEDAQQQPAPPQKPARLPEFPVDLRRESLKRRSQERTHTTILLILLFMALAALGVIYYVIF